MHLSIALALVHNCKRVIPALEGVRGPGIPGPLSVDAGRMLAHGIARSTGAAWNPTGPQGAVGCDRHY